MKQNLYPLSWLFSMAMMPVVATAQHDLLDPMTQPRFEHPLPFPGNMQPQGNSNNYRVSITQFDQWLGLVDPMDGNTPLMTTVWGYNGSYPGPTIHTRRGQRVTARWDNDLVDANGDPLPHLLPVDQSLHWADPLGMHAMGGHPSGPYMGPVPVVTHLHGGRTESASDGLPEAWYTPDYKITGADFVKRMLRYDNDQEAATIWYHDHALGITRLNVYAGLAGFYLIHDAVEDQLIATRKLPHASFEIPLVIQDRMFTDDGQLYMPSSPDDLEEGDHSMDMGGMMTEHPPVPDPTVVAEFFGDHILVNGRAWPFHNVQPRKYRLRLLNGSDSRFYRLAFSNGMPFIQVATDLGFLPQAVQVDTLLIAPGERMEVVVDFSLAQGQHVVLENYGPDSPFKGGEVPEEDLADPMTTGRIMQFRVVSPLSNITDATTAPGTVLRAPIAPLVQSGMTRELVLLEMIDEYGRLKPSLGTVADGALDWFAPVTENPGFNDVEVWEVYNATEDAHPIHLHLVGFQIIDRQSFEADVDEGTGALSNIVFTDAPREPEPNEKGWKDTAVMLPGEVTRIIAKFDRMGLYVWHCHILSHEDHEMMRPFRVLPPGHAKAMDQIVQEGLSVFPNPFTDQIDFVVELPDAGTVKLEVMDMLGRQVHSVVREAVEGGFRHQWNGAPAEGGELANGSYVFRILLDDQVLHTGRLERIR
jgi:spore coat protein A, manganese oxidase